MDKKELYQYVGSMQQMAYIRKVTCEEGSSTGLRMFDVKNECLQYQVMCDKCLDVAGLTYKGINMNFLSKPGLQGRNHYDTNGQEALRSIMGGLFFTAGMDEKRPGAESIRHYERGGAFWRKYGSPPYY